MGPDTPISQPINGNTAFYLANTQMQAAGVQTNSDAKLSEANLFANYVEVNQVTNGGLKDQPPIVPVNSI